MQVVEHFSFGIQEVKPRKRLLKKTKILSLIFFNKKN